MPDGTISVEFVPPSFVGVTLKEEFEQIVAVTFEIIGVGFTVTVTTKDVVQLLGEVPEEAVTV